jgi:hypothetical protein
MQKYATWVVGRHQEQDPNNIDVRVGTVAAVAIAMI